MNKFLLLTVFASASIFVSDKVAAQGMAVNATGAGAATSSMMDVASTSKGVLIPRMTTTQMNAIGSPATGLMIYNTTTNAFNYYNGTAWAAVGGGASGSAGGDLTGTYPSPTVTSGAITNAKVSATAAIAYSKLNLTASISPSVDLATTGTPSATTFLRGDNKWAVPSGGSTGIDYIGMRTTSTTSLFNYAPAAGTQAITYTANSVSVAPTTCTPTMDISSYTTNGITWTLYAVTPDVSGTYTLGSSIMSCSTTAATGSTAQTCTATASGTVAAGTFMTLVPSTIPTSAGGFLLSFSCH